MLFTCIINSCVVLSFMDTLLVFVTFCREKKFLLSPQLLLGPVSLIYAPFSLESKRSKRRGFILFFLQFSHEFGSRGSQQYTGCWFFIHKCNWSWNKSVKGYFEFHAKPNFRFIFIVYFSLFFGVFHLKFVYFNFFLLLLSDSIFVDIARSSFLVMLLEILWAFFICVVKAPFLK